MNTGLILKTATVLALAIVLSRFMPTWFVFLLVISAAKGIVALGVIIAMRGGLVSFGQGLFFAGGAYTSGLMAQYWGVSDFLAQSILGTATGLLLATVAAANAPIAYRLPCAMFRTLSTPNTSVSPAATRNSQDA